MVSSEMCTFCSFQRKMSVTLAQTLTQPLEICWFNRLVGLVVKASASRAEDPGFDSRLRRGDFSGVES